MEPKFIKFWCGNMDVFINVNKINFLNQHEEGINTAIYLDNGHVITVSGEVNEILNKIDEVTNGMRNLRRK